MKNIANHTYEPMRGYYEGSYAPVGEPCIYGLR